jgi:hypothetical protein
MTPVPTDRADDRYHGFSLKSVCWGYREIFRQTLDGLFREGVVGPDRREVTATVFGLLKQADRNHFDHVLKEFLGALNPDTRWLVDLPGLFADLVELGSSFAHDKLHYGIRFFETFGAGGFGRTPADVRQLLTHLRRLREIDRELAMAFLSGYRHLVERLDPQELELYIRAGLDIHRRNPASGRAFLAGSLQTSETYIRSLTHECRLEDVRAPMAALLHALTGRDVEVLDLGELDSDELIERGSTVVCMAHWLHVPGRVRDFDRARRNRDWYLLTAVVAAAMLDEHSFPRVHGHPDYRSARDVVGDDPLRLNLFQIVEYVRILRRIRRRWPGARSLLAFGLQAEREARPPASAADRLFFDAALGQPDEAAELVRCVADASVNFFDTARRLDGDWAGRVRDARPGLDRSRLRPFGFLPDFRFPGTVSRPPPDRLVADLQRAARTAGEPGESDTGDRPRARAVGDEEAAAGDADEAEEAVAAGYVYDEWSEPEHDYLRDHCMVHETRPQPRAEAAPPDDVAAEARRVRRVFERFKPDLARREKYLRDGEVINADLLVEYLVQRRREPSPRLRFYERPRIRRRDLAVLVLLDCSGSTGEHAEGRDRIIDVEKHAGLILGQGLAALGDRFALAGFHSNGPEHCSFLVVKDFDQPWDRDAAARMLAVAPANSTRIGPALRHAGTCLRRIDARRRLILLITDGRPMDSGYDPNTRYAQHDVRVACEENARAGIHTFGISTEENSLADMEIMFPGRRFAILPDIRRLARVLPKAYLRLTT